MLAALSVPWISKFLNGGNISDVMLRELFALEDGRPSTLAEEMRCSRWVSLSLCRNRSMRPQIGDEFVDTRAGNFCFDVDTPSASVVLTAGTVRDNGDLGFVGAFAVPEDHPFGCNQGFSEDVYATARTCAPLALSCGPETDGPIDVVKWPPGDSSIFVTGARNGVVVTWDSNNFEPCARSELLGEVDGQVKLLELAALDLSRAPGACQGLVAVACQANDVRLLDLKSNSASQCLSGHSSSVQDVTWSPTNPNLLATAGADGTARLFDIRRSGHVACLYIFDMERTLTSSYSAANDHSFHGRPSKRRRKELLDVGMAWKAPDAVLEGSRRQRRMRRLQRRSKTRSSHDGRVQRIRFSPDGRSVVTSGSDGRVRVWDSMSGHCLLSSFSDIYSGMGQFEVSGDSSIIVSCLGRGIRLHDIVTGGVLSSPAGSFGCPTNIVIHPSREELFTATSDGEILCWSVA